MGNQNGFQYYEDKSQNLEIDEVIKLYSEKKYTVKWIKNNPKEFNLFSTDKKRGILGAHMSDKVSKCKIRDINSLNKITEMLIDLEILELSEIIQMLEED